MAVMNSLLNKVMGNLELMPPLAMTITLRTFLLTE